MGTHIGATKRRRVLSRAVSEADEPVEGDLGHEPPQQAGGHRRAPASCGGDAAGAWSEGGEGVDDQGRAPPRRPRSWPRSTTTDRVTTAEMARQASLLGAGGQAVDEDRDEGGRQHAAQDDVVEHVGGGVGQVVGVGQVRGAERVGQHQDPEQPR